ncbi:MAG: hydrolase [Cyclobacteriaceae bacterium]
MKKVMLLLTVLSAWSVVAQKKNAHLQLLIKKTDIPVKIDGINDDPAWESAQAAQNFHMVLPMDTGRANVITTVRMSYDDQFIYLLAECYLPKPNTIFVESMRRDWNFGLNDNFIFFLDTYHDQTNGYTFGVNAAGAQWDGTMYEGNNVDLSWDNKWESKVIQHPDKYVLEMALPFKSIRYKAGIDQWGINFSRNDLYTTEKSAWAPVPRQFPTSTLAYTGTLQWDKSPPPPAKNVSIIPYVLGSSSKNYVGDDQGELRFDIGGDAKIALSSSLNLDLTVNPDFSQVDVDQQVTNLERFELFFPERRQFFLENGDLFANFGYRSMRPFFSRRIGLQAPIRFGARLSGKLDENWRIGAMDMQTGQVEALALPSQNFAVFALQRKVMARSNIGLLAVNRQSYGMEVMDSASTSAYNRNLGAEFNLASSNNLWTGKILAMKSFSPDEHGSDVSHAANLRYASRSWEFNWKHEYVGEDFIAETGFVPRTGYINVSPEIGYTFLPKGGPLLSHGPTIGALAYFDTKMNVTDHTEFFSYRFTSRQKDFLMIWSGYDDIRLLFPFDPTNTDKEQLQTDSRHTWWSWGTEFSSRPQNLFTFRFNTRVGGYYADGHRYSYGGTLGYRFQPYVNLNVKINYNKISLPAPWDVTTFWLVGPRLDVTFTEKMYFTGFLQYNEQINNLNINTRFQWRYAPASDLFIVYTDNYLPEPFGVKNRAIVLKLTYWWNL